MKILAFLFTLLVTAAVLAMACSTQGGDEPQVGKLRSESKSVDPKDTQSVRAQLKDWVRSMPRGLRGWATRTSTTPMAN